ncbi:MAG: glycosyltransferase family 39 protein [Planctomycetaceae bacterium]|nr:glycosyltransferase family 39 protein [Planctomycetaceae bacterium]
MPASDASLNPSRPARTGLDAAIIAALALVVILNSAAAPSNFYRYAQLWQAGAAMGMIESGDVLMPRTHAGGLMRKGQVFNILAAAAVLATGQHDDWVFCLPTGLATIVTALLVYVLGRRWFNRRVGLLAACLWLTTLHARKLAFVATTDMMLTLWITLAVLCLDRLLFHPSPRPRALAWAAGLWTAMILAALTKGWGIVNVPLVAGVAALGAALGPGFGDVGHGVGLKQSFAVVCRLVGQRWWQAAKTLRLWWGLPLLAAAVYAVLYAMGARAGDEFKGVLDFEIIQRITGQGEHAPAAASLPVVLSLIYYALPASVFALGALAMVPARQWLTREGGIYVPLIWVIVTVVLFTLPHGFRPDYLLPCYGGLAIMGAWSIDELARLAGRCGRTPRFLRHVYAFAAVLIGATGLVLGLLLGLHGHLGSRLATLLPWPAVVPPAAHVLLWVAAAIGLAAAAWAIAASLRWRVRQVAAAACVGMLGVMFLYQHFLSEAARYGDGEAMRQFSRRSSAIIGGDRVMTSCAEKAGFALYHGRFCPILSLSDPPAKEAVLGMSWNQMQKEGIRWLVTCDRGLVEMGQYEPVGPDANPDTGKRYYRYKTDAGKYAATVLPDLLAEQIVLESRPVHADGFGRFYLIRLKDGAQIHAKPFNSGQVRKADLEAVEDD